MSSDIGKVGQNLDPRLGPILQSLDDRYFGLIGGYGEDLGGFPPGRDSTLFSPLIMSGMMNGFGSGMDLETLSTALDKMTSSSEREEAKKSAIPSAAAGTSSAAAVRLLDRLFHPHTGGLEVVARGTPIGEFRGGDDLSLEVLKRHFSIWADGIFRAPANMELTHMQAGKSDSLRIFGSQESNQVKKGLDFVPAETGNRTEDVKVLKRFLSLNPKAPDQNEIQKRIKELEESQASESPGTVPDTNGSQGNSTFSDRARASKV